MLTVFAKLLDYGVWSFRVLEGPEWYVMEEGILLSCNDIFTVCVVGNIAMTKIQLGTPRHSLTAIKKKLEWLEDVECLYIARKWGQSLDIVVVGIFLLRR